jgi:hypothetical protein
MKTANVFKILHIVAWVIFVGLCIEASGLIVNFFFSLYKPEFIQNLYQKLDLTGMYHRSNRAFFGMYGFILVISLLKVYLFYVVVILMHKMDLSKPFNTFVSRQITRISYFTFSIGILSYIAQQTAKILQRKGYFIDNSNQFGILHYIAGETEKGLQRNIDNLNQFWVDSQAFILMGAVIYIIATIFKKGVEIQNENDLTV